MSAWCNALSRRCLRTGPHRLDAAEGADRVVVLGEQGEIIADGTPGVRVRVLSVARQTDAAVAMQSGGGAFGVGNRPQCVDFGGDGAG